MKTTNEKLFLSNYNINNYEQYSIATDIVAFSMNIKKGENYRQDPKNSLSLLLIQRGEYPYKDMWALPGGFLRGNETIEECACRESVEETGVLPSALVHIGVFSKPNRDPRGRIISNAFLSVTDKISTNLHSENDAVLASWFNVSFDYIDNLYILRLVNEQDSIQAKLRISPNKFGKIEFDIIENKKLAFDHASIIATAITILRKSAEKFDFIFDFLPQKFTLSELQNVQSIIMNKPVLSANFRRKISDYVIETDEYTSGAGHRPAKLFIRKH